ncbi:MAG: hypothetical protein HDS68_00675 [Bacteroidales bacterium]|nr:hypothetical protein [Bacteroidales bacterium]
MLIPLLLQSCFTGVESTPKITYREVKENKADGTSPEAAFAAGFSPQKFTDWQEGKPFYVTSDRIGLVLAPDNSEYRDIEPKEGDVIFYDGVRTVADLTGNEIAELLFRQSDGSNGRFAYRTGYTVKELSERVTVEIPFAIDLDLVKEWDRALAGKEYYIKTPLWVDGNGNQQKGKKFVKVKIRSVKAANEVYPFMVVFEDESGNMQGVFMASQNDARWAPRAFPAVFSFTDPHAQYPKITDAMWNNIQNTRVAEGMTKTEASLALGTPANIDRGHDHSSAYERWRYSDGVYLIFEDGLLTRHN